MGETVLEPLAAVEAADRLRLSTLAGQSERDNTVLVEFVFRDQWVRFDISKLEAEHVTGVTLFERYFGKALAAVGIPRDAADSSLSSTSVLKE